MGEPPTLQRSGGSHGCWDIKGTRNPTADTQPCPGDRARRPDPTVLHISRRVHTVFRFGVTPGHSVSEGAGISHIRPICAIPGHFGQVPFRSVEARCTTRACRTGFPRAGGPVRLRATRLSLGSRTTTRGSLRSPTQRSPSVTSSNVEWTGRSLPLPLFLRFSRGRHKQVGKLRRIPGGVTFLSGLTGRPSRNRERSVKPRRDLWSVAVG